MAITITSWTGLARQKEIQKTLYENSGVEMNLKVGGGAQARHQIFFVILLHFFGSTSTISHVGERFRDGQYSLISILFAVLLLTVPLPPVPSHL